MKTIQEFLTTRAGVIMVIVLVICVTVMVLAAMYFGRSFSELYDLIMSLAGG